MHRDIKPRNLFLTPGGIVKVLDFGVAALMGAGELIKFTIIGQTVGTPPYMAPEQALASTVGPPADLYALGCVLHEMLSGQLPFTPSDGVSVQWHHVRTLPLAGHGHPPWHTGRCRDAHPPAPAQEPLFEEFKVRNGTMLTRLHGEPLFLRACIQHVNDAGKQDEGIHSLDRSIASRVQAVITAAAFPETFVNGVGVSLVERWELYEKLTVEGKWQLCLAIAGHPAHFDPGREPFQTMGKIITFRNRWMHYGPIWENVVVSSSGPLTWIDARMSVAFIATLPERLVELVVDLCQQCKLAVPAWATPLANWNL
jgi:hypothetical protein